MSKKHHHEEGVEHVEAPVPETPAPAQVLSVNFPSKGLSFTLPVRYHTGHHLTENEANALNGLLCENLRNNFSKTVEDAEEEAAKAGTDIDASDLQTKFAAYAEGYSFQGKRAPRAPVDPVRREAEKIASAKIDEALRQKGKSRKGLKEGLFDELVDRLIASDGDIMEEAKRRVSYTKSVAEESVLAMLEE